MDYSKIGEHIRLIDNRNTDLAIDKLVGLTVDKRFIPSVANIIGTDLSKYKVIRKNQFACSLMQVSRDGKMPVAMFTEEAAIMSPAYPMFEVKDDRKLLPEYLMMYLYRSEFDREAVFYAVGGVRGSLEWEDFCNITLPVPPIEEQRRIVNEYQTVERRIKNNEALIQKLEEAAQAIYHHTFVEGIDENNLPNGWKMGCIGDYCKLKSGYAFQSEEWTESGFPVIKIGNISSSGQLDMSSCSFIASIPNNSNNNFKAFPFDVIIAMTGATIGKSCIIPLDTYNTFINQRVGKFILGDSPKMKMPFIYCTLNDNLINSQILNIGQGSAQANFSSSDIESIAIPIPSQNILESFNVQVGKIFEYLLFIQKELHHLRTLQSLLTSKLA